MTPHGADEDHEQRSEREDDQQPGQHVRQRRQLRDVSDLATGVRLQHDRAELVEQRSPRRVAVDAGRYETTNCTTGVVNPSRPSVLMGSAPPSESLVVSSPAVGWSATPTMVIATEWSPTATVAWSPIPLPIRRRTSRPSTISSSWRAGRPSTMRRVHRTPVRFDGGEADRQAIDRRAGTGAKPANDPTSLLPDSDCTMDWWSAALAGSPASDTLLGLPTITSQFHPCSLGVSTRWRRLLPTVIEATTPATARAIPTIAVRGPMPRRRSKAIATPAAATGPGCRHPGG